MCIFTIFIYHSSIIMCIDCSHSGCSGCVPKSNCKCNFECIKCFTFYQRSSCQHILPTSHYAFRQKYVCLSCNLCWKEKNDKYREEYIYSRYNWNNPIKSAVISFRQPGWLTDYEHKKHDYKTDASCRKCHGEPIKVGNKFRAPKQNDIKAWNKIKELDSKEQKKLFADYCPYDSGHKRNYRQSFYNYTRGNTTYEIVEKMYPELKKN